MYARGQEGKTNMASFIIYDHDYMRRETYIKIIKKFLYTNSDHYEIYEFDKYNSDVQEQIRKIEGPRIYLINVDVPGLSGLDLARRIRMKGDFISPIILLTEKDKSKLADNLQNILFLDLIELNDNIIKPLLISLKDAYRIVTRYCVYTFSVFDEVYRIPYNDIYYIKKNLNDDSVTIYTKDDSYLNYITVKGIEQSLEKDPRFFKAHRSCIINLYNVSTYDRKSNIVVFNNGMHTDLVSRHNKSILAEKLKEYSNTN